MPTIGFRRNIINTAFNGGQIFMLQGQKTITDFEDRIIRYGVQTGQTKTEIARFIGKSRQTVHNRVKAMIADGRLSELDINSGRSDEQ